MSSEFIEIKTLFHTERAVNVAHIVHIERCYRESRNEYRTLITPSDGSVLETSEDYEELFLRLRGQ